MVSLDGFKAWLATKNPEEEFRYSDNYNCCFARYCKEACDMPDVFVAVDEYYPSGDWGNRSFRIPVEIAKGLRDLPGDLIKFGTVQQLFGVENTLIERVQ